VFQDTDGKIIAQCFGTKTATLQEGSRLYVGNKEVEVTLETLHYMVPNSLKIKYGTRSLPHYCQYGLK
jgi:hypothetical protein